MAVSKEFNRVFIIETPKPSEAQGYVPIDITKWLDGNNIASVAFTAKIKDTSEDVSATVLNDSNSTFTSKVLQPYIQAGTDGETYVADIVVTDNGAPANIETFYLEWSIDDNIPLLDT